MQQRRKWASGLMAQSDNVQLPRQLRAPCYECSRECISTEACTAPYGQNPVNRSCLQQHVNICNDNACCELPEPEPHQNIAKLAGARAAASSHLYVRCPSFCNKQVAVAEIKLAKEGRNREIWNCSHCRTIKKKQVKIAWCDFVCVQCTHTQGEICLIKYCTSNCPTRTALEKRRLNKVDRTFKKAKSMMTSLKEHELLERLTVLKAAWILGHGRMPQPWFKLDQRFSTKKLMFMLHSGYQAIEATRSVRLPAGFSDDVANNFHFHNCMTRLQMESKADRNGCVFNYKNEFYQDVRHFCKNYNGNKTAVRKDVVSTKFPKTAYLVVPGHSYNNWKHIPAAWKNGTQDLSTLKGAAYILGRRKKKPGRHLRLVSLTELQRAAAASIISAERRKHSEFIQRKRAAKERKQSWKSVIKGNGKCK